MYLFKVAKSRATEGQGIRQITFASTASTTHAGLRLGRLVVMFDQGSVHLHLYVQTVLAQAKCTFALSAIWGVVMEVAVVACGE